MSIRQQGLRTNHATGCQSFVAVLAALAFACNFACGQLVEWTQLQPPRPSSHAIAYDSARSAIVLFGGDTSLGLNGETWEWNGVAWAQQRPVNGPSARRGHAMAYDAKRGVTVLFGGFTIPGTFNGETWEWDGHVWTRHDVSGPTARYGHALAYDPVNRVTVLFGGSTGAEVVSNETWTWDGNAWKQHSSDEGPRPSARTGHAMTYDASFGATVLFGGNAGNNVLNGETWLWNGNAWKELEAENRPTPRHLHAMAHDVSGATLIFGGTTGSSGDAPNGETWELTKSGWAEREVDGPPARFGHAMAYDEGRRVSVLFGGYDGSVRNGETWLWNGNIWAQRTASGPSPRNSHAIAYDAIRNVTVLFGGDTVGGGSGPNAETWEWNGDTSTWTQEHPDLSPSPRYFHAMAYDLARERTVLFGGIGHISGNIINNETWEWDGKAWSKKCSNWGPSPRFGHAMAYDARRGVTVLFGGLTGDPFLSNGETWEWDGTVWTLKCSNCGPSPRRTHAMAYDSVREVTVLFGGYTIDNVDSDETWEWNGTEWALQCRSCGPLPRHYHAMAYDLAREKTVLFGGNNNAIGSNFADTWEWNGLSWSQQPINGPSARNAFAMAYDVVRRTTVLFGGYNGFVSNGETWGLSTPCLASSVTTQPFDQLTCPFGPAAFSVTASGTSTLTYQWQYQAGPAGTVPITWTNLVSGANLVDGQFTLHATGALTPLLVVDHDPTYWADTSLDAVFEFRCVVANACGSVSSDTASLFVCAADFDCDGFVTGLDFDAFVAAFESGDPSADFDHDGFITGVDFDDFVRAFEAGC